jgi:hypothetical protein
MSSILLTLRCPPIGPPWISASTSFTLLHGRTIWASWSFHQPTRSGAPSRHLSLLGSSIGPSIFCKWECSQWCSFIQDMVQCPLPVVFAPCCGHSAVVSLGWFRPNDPQQQQRGLIPSSCLPVFVLQLCFQVFVLPTQSCSTTLQSLLLVRQKCEMMGRGR